MGTFLEEGVVVERLGGIAFEICLYVDGKGILGEELLRDI
jgi:hypothetical protein